jgi:hypothetical protein
MTTMTAQQIYDIFHNAPGTATWQAARAAADQLGEDMPQLAADIKRIQDMMNAAWHGAAADIASQGAEPLALEYINTADGLRTAQDLVERQTGSFHTAASSVQPVPPQPTTVDVIDAALGAPDMQQQMTNYLAAAQHNVDVYSAYHGASQYNTSNLPMDYGHLAMDNTGVTETGAPPPASAGAVPQPRAGLAAPKQVTTAATSARSGGTPTRSSTEPTVRPTAATGTDPSTPPTQPSTAPSTSRPPRAGLPDPIEPTASPDPQPVTTTASEPGSFDSSTTSVPIFDDLGAIGGQGNSGVAFGVSPLVEPGDGSGTTYRQPGQDVVDRPGPLDGPTTERTSAATGVSATEEPEFAPVAGMSSRRRDEDEEHHISAYLEPDANELFGSPERPVRPVIGA